MTELEVCYSTLAEMHAYELITLIDIGKNVFTSFQTSLGSGSPFPLEHFVPLNCDTLLLCFNISMARFV